MYELLCLIFIKCRRLVRIIINRDLCLQIEITLHNTVEMKKILLSALTVFTIMAQAANPFFLGLIKRPTKPYRSTK